MLKHHQLNSAVKRLARFVLMSLGLILISATHFSQTTTKPAPQTNARRASEIDVRVRQLLNEGWKFSPSETKDAQKITFDDAGWSAVNLPHTWNVEDTQDDAPGYRMGVGWYRKKLILDGRFRDRKIFLYFEAANQVADVFVNGNFIGQHKGGYTAFAFDISNNVFFDARRPNLIAVRVDNSINNDIPPAPSADFNLYGGIYRDVWLVATEPVHLTVTDHAAPGVYVDTPTVSDASATVRARGSIINESNESRTVRVVSAILDADGRAAGVMESTLTLAAGQRENFEQLSKPVFQPHLWSPEDPYLYSLQTLVFEGERPLDSIKNPLGFRWFSFDAGKGFSLNGKPYRLRGANRHQDYLGMGNAVPNELQIKDMELIKELGLNCVLLAHYPQDAAVLEAADRLGLIVWEEIPILRQISTTAEFTNNCKLMLTEMIRQHYNHPSVMMWCYMNEIFLRRGRGSDYVPKVVALAKELDALARQEDSGRMTVISANRDELYNTSGLADIPQLFAWHMYFGWYYGTLPELGIFLDEQHKRFPGRKLFVSEYGADSDGRLHSLNPSRAYYSTEWAQEFHQSYLEQLEARPYLNGMAVWNAFDFGSESRGESVPHMNKKGLFTYDRQPKDIAYFYKASFAKSPVLYIATREWSRRSGAGAQAKKDAAQPTANQPVTVYSNLPEAELLVNGRSLGAKKFADAHFAVWEVPFREGRNTLEARGSAGGQTVSDRAEVQFSLRPQSLKNASAPFTQLAVNVGSGSQFVDETGLVWEADQPYSPGGWGFIGGAEGKTDQNILGTADDPLYRTFRKGIERYRFDVPDGNYEVELRFTEPRYTGAGEHLFSISANGQRLVAELDLSKEYGVWHAGSRTVKVAAIGGQGVELQFQAVKGETVLSAIRLRRLP